LLTQWKDCIEKWAWITMWRITTWITTTQSFWV
jgi:hypothetical protein